MSEKSHGKHLTAAEWKTLTENDPIVQFYERVVSNAYARPNWHSHYAMAVYEALGEEYGLHVLRELGVASYCVDPEPPPAEMRWKNVETGEIVTTYRKSDGSYTSLGDGNFTALFEVEPK